MEKRQIIRAKLLEDIAKHRFKHWAREAIETDKPTTKDRSFNKDGYVTIVEAPDYLINQKGTVRRIKDGYIIKPRFDKEGYSRVCLAVNKKNRMFRVHRLLALAFIPNPESKPCVNHKDGIKGNNDLSNLEWCTHKENFEHAKSVLKVGIHAFTVDQILLNKMQHLIDTLQDIKKRDECSEALRVKIDRALIRVRTM